MTSIQVCFLAFLTLGSLNVSAGGISGGGGTVINPDKPTKTQNPEVIEHVISNSKPQFYAYVQKKYQDFLAGRLSPVENDLYAKLFSSNSQDLNSVMKKYSVYVDDKSPCYSSDRTPVDGSIYSSVPNSVCISAVAFAEKVDYPQVTKQSIALMLHEYGEVSGLSEDDAVTLQKSALVDLH